jgi:4a-hydroxytetrahydrobiopterin dehydratase
MNSDINDIDHWNQESNYLKRIIIFKDFKEALRAMRLIGEVAEELNHHPNWSNCYNRLEIKLFTHTTGTVTDLDYLLASRINDIVSKIFMI